MKGRLIVLEGTDCSGKSTQFKLLCDYLDNEKIKYKKIVFPRYNEESSALIRMYLNGDFGNKPTDVSPYTASVFFAVDRYASFMKDWKTFYNEGGLIIADRYTTSNAIHQASKLDEKNYMAFLDWLFDFEYNIMTLPKPDKVLFLDMPTDFAAKLLINREGKTVDIHESDLEYLDKCYNMAINIAENYNWLKIHCVRDNNIRSINDIHNEITSVIKEIF